MLHTNYSTSNKNTKWKRCKRCKNCRQLFSAPYFLRYIGINIYTIWKHFNYFLILQGFLDIAICIIHVFLNPLLSLSAGGAVQPSAEGEEWLTVPHRGRPGGPERACEEAQVCSVSGLLHTHPRHFSSARPLTRVTFILFLLIMCKSAIPPWVCNLMDTVKLSLQLPTVPT